MHRLRLELSGDRVVVAHVAIAVDTQTMHDVSAERRTSPSVAIARIRVSS